jgi:hypothetical protein
MRVDGTWPKFSIDGLLRLNDVTGWQLRTSIAPPFLWQLASVVADVISVCVELLVAAGKWQNSGSIVFRVMANVIPLLVPRPKYLEGIAVAVTYSLSLRRDFTLQMIIWSTAPLFLLT